jgi:hypothetical protein
MNHPPSLWRFPAERLTSQAFWDCFDAIQLSPSDSESLDRNDLDRAQGVTSGIVGRQATCQSPFVILRLYELLLLFRRMGEIGLLNPARPSRVDTISASRLVLCPRRNLRYVALPSCISADHARYGRACQFNAAVAASPRRQWSGSCRDCRDTHFYAARFEYFTLFDYGLECTLIYAASELFSCGGFENHCGTHIGNRLLMCETHTYGFVVARLPF